MSNYAAGETPDVTQTSSAYLWTAIRANVSYLAWVQALVATIGSLYFSEVMKFVPCVLCWYQRILMYPLVLVIAVGILLRDQRIKVYVLPISIVGLAISLYHNLLQYDVIPEAITPCIAGVSCTTPWINWFGFVTIPLLSLVAFSIISLCMIFHKCMEVPYDKDADT
ncbi:MAG: disulfide bond formation protein B [Anaerolineae bacterium]|nr:disulfide bond formation protein B [Anaerolineae bacterium]